MTSVPSPADDPAVDHEPEVLTEVVGGSTLLVTLNRPHVRNAVDDGLARGLAAAIDRLDGDPALRAGVLTGAGKGFCSGMDLRAFAAGERGEVAGRGFAGITERGPSKPLIAAVEGFALAGGFEIVLAGDLIVAASDAVLGLPEVTRGITAAAGGLLRLPRRIPYHLAMEAALTGAPFDAPRAHALGLVNRLAVPGSAVDDALALAETLARNAPLSVEASKRVVRDSGGWSDGEAWDRQREILEPVQSSDDAREGAVAFTERRAPVWRGR